MAIKKFSLSANIETGFPDGYQYIVTPNAQKVTESIVNGYQSGIHSYTIIGTYGTGKSSYIIALKEDLLKGKKNLLLNTRVLSENEQFETLDIVGDYESLPALLGRKLNVEGTGKSIIDELGKYYAKLKKLGTMLVIFIDEFGKVLEHAAKNNPEEELYFMQKLAEFVNNTNRHILLLTTLHQNFSAYAKGLNEHQRNEWTKVKGRFLEVVFVEPVEQLLFLASKQIDHREAITPALSELGNLHRLAVETRFVSNSFTNETAKSLYPLDPFAAFAITKAIQRYGQNERSLFTFLNTRGSNSLSEFEAGEHLTYNLQCVYDYIIYNFYSYLKDANADSMNWSAMQIAIERVEGQPWENAEQLVGAIKLVKAIGLLNLFGTATFEMSREQMVKYAKHAMDVADAEQIIATLERQKIIRFAEYKHRLILFEGTDINIEEEISKAGLVVSRSVNYVDDLRKFFMKKVAPVKAYYYHRGTPRYFAYMVQDEPLDVVPQGDVDGYIEFIFASADKREAVQTFSEDCQHAIIVAFFNNTEEIVDHLYNIEKYDYILDKVLLDKSDRVAVTEINNLKDYELVMLNKAITDSLYARHGHVTWFFHGKPMKVQSLRDFNKLLSSVCDDVYSLTPVMHNELFNKNKLSGSISSAKAKYLAAMLEHSDEADFGFDADKFPPEKTIYYALLKSTGLHIDGHFAEAPSNDGIATLWAASEEFLKTTSSKPRKISELVKKLSAQPYKLKAGFLDFWIPTYLYIKRQDYSLYGNNGVYIPEVNMEFFELLQKHPASYLVKAFDVSGVKMEFFNQYRKFVNLEAVGGIKSNQLIDTIKPFFFFYNRRLNDYAKHTRKFDHDETRAFRDILARAKDPEKTFLEDLPEALGYDRDAQGSEEFAKQYAYIINRAVKELRGCYTKLIERIEERLVEELHLSSYDYSEYVAEIRQRLANVKTYLLTDRQREFYNHAMAEFDNRTEWYQSVCYTALDQPLERLRDEQEEKLINELIILFQECERYADISKVNDDGSEVYAFDLVSNRGDNIKPQTYQLYEQDKAKVTELETKINELLSGDDNVDVVALLKILKERMKK